MKLFNIINFIAALTRITGIISRAAEVRRWRRKMLRDLNRRRRC